MARPGKSLIFPDPGSLRDKYYAAADEKWRMERPPPRQSRFKSFFEELERRRNTMSKQEDILEPEEDVELQEDRPANDCRVEQELEAGVEPPTSTGVNDVHDEDNGSILRSTCEGSANRPREEALTGGYRTPVDSNCENQHLDGTHEEPGQTFIKEAPNDSHRIPVNGNIDNQHLTGTNDEPVDVNHGNHFDGADEAHIDGNRNEQLPDDTHKDLIVGAHEKSDECTREEAVDQMCEELDGRTVREKVPSTNGESVFASHDEPLNNDNHEASVPGTLPDSSSHHAQESSSEPRPDPPRRRGKPKYKRLLEFDNLRPSL